jgi:hypothetical protein
VLATLRDVTARGAGRGAGRSAEPSQRQLADFADLDPVYVSKRPAALSATA